MWTGSGTQVDFFETEKMLAHGKNKQKPDNTKGHMLKSKSLE